MAKSQMTLEEKVGQLFILAFPGKDSNALERAAQIISNYHIGGCYISQDNAETFDEAWRLSRTLQGVAKSSGPKLPLLLGVDQEGAWGVLIPEATIGPGNLALGLNENTDQTEEIYGIFAQEMGAVGYNCILGPCADVNLDVRNPIIGTRSFGEKPKQVAAHVRAAIRALRNKKVISCAKHFPGHGDTHSDSHREIPVVDKPLYRLREQELLPFQAAIDEGVDMIMSSHILYPQLDKTFPATLSHNILTGLLREDMGFGGVLITDSMNMGAIRRFYQHEEAAVQSLLAGADLIMLSEEHYDHSTDYWAKQQAEIRAVIRAVQTGRIPAAQLDKKLERMIRLKQKIQPGQSEPPSIKPIPKPQSREAEQRIARSAVRLLRPLRGVRNQNGAIPLKTAKSLALLNATPKSAYRNLLNARGIGPNQAEPAFEAFAALFCNHRPETAVLDFDQNLEDALSRYDAIIVVTEDHPLPGEDFEKTLQIQRVQQLLQNKTLCDRLIILALRSPYDLLEFGAAQCYISTHSGRSCSARAAALAVAAPNAWPAVLAAPAALAGPAANAWPAKPI